MGAQDMAMGHGSRVAASTPRSEVRKVVFASSLGTVFVWYDFYLHATPAPFSGSRPWTGVTALS